jgi:hypothetical protein
VKYISWVYCNYLGSGLWTHRSRIKSSVIHVVKGISLIEAAYAAFRKPNAVTGPCGNFVSEITGL